MIGYIFYINNKEILLVIILLNEFYFSGEFWCGNWDEYM